MARPLDVAFNINSIQFSSYYFSGLIKQGGGEAQVRLLKNYATAAVIRWLSVDVLRDAIYAKPIYSFRD